MTTEKPASHPHRQVALDWLLGRINYERTAFVPYQDRQLKLDRMRQLLTRLGQPDAGMKIVHVAGTKGKGSTSAMIAAMLTSAGYRTGVFSSPHLERIEERFTVDGQPCTADELIALVDRLRPIVASMDAEAAADGDPTGGPTYFDVTTAMALVHFVERQVDAAVLEVGLGGRLDSTNVCLPVVSVITSISFDHMKQLGNTLAAIAREKSGIIKPGVPVICGVTQPEPQSVIAEVAREHGCRLIQLGDVFQYRYVTMEDCGLRHPEGTRDCGLGELKSEILNPKSEIGAVKFDYNIPGQELHLAPLPLAMRGPHQAANAAVALAAVAELRHQGWCISTDAMRLGLSRAKLAGRVEVVAGEPTVVLDTAHNPASARALVEALAEMAAAPRRTLVLSISHDKDVRAIVHELAPHFDRIVVTQYQDNPRAIGAKDLAQIVHDILGDARVEVCVSPTPHEAWHYVCRTAISHERACITGSFYLAAEMRRLVLTSAATATAGS
ncbi:MAG: bifunctional folylpolyglutamate synthase/dihydrofolate synthase [Planctomycetes bacterium]|nr:bifunctional folylpolyglutamate synthase/dihydrofolate synthase [Planctomycetota bacterium]